MLAISGYGKVGKVISGLALIFCFNLIQGCYYYKISTSKTSRDQALVTSQNQGKYIILHDNRYSMRHLSNVNVVNETIKASISNIVGHTKYNDTELLDVYTTRYKKNKRVDESEVINEVHVFVSKYKLIGNDQISIPIKAVDRIEVYNPAKGRTTMSWICSILGITLLSYTVIGTIVVAIAWNAF